jgi:hypothetical protein
MKFYKAIRPPEVPDLEIIATEEIPEDYDGGAEDGWQRRSHAFFDGQGREIATRLLRSLPGGTVDALLVALLDHRRSHFIVRHELQGESIEDPDFEVKESIEDPDFEVKE